MAELQHWYLIAYDIRSPSRWRKAHELLLGYGDKLQYSIFRCWLSQRSREKLRWQLEQILEPEDDLLLIRLSHQCVKDLGNYNRPNAWSIDEAGYRIL
jgi:CRISPR-associated protein Cas2